MRQRGCIAGSGLRAGLRDSGARGQPRGRGAVGTAGRGRRLEAMPALREAGGPCHGHGSCWAGPAGREEPRAALATRLAPLGSGSGLSSGRCPGRGSSWGARLPSVTAGRAAGRVAGGISEQAPGSGLALPSAPSGSPALWASGVTGVMGTPPPGPVAPPGRLTAATLLWASALGTDSGVFAVSEGLESPLPPGSPAPRAKDVSFPVALGWASARRSTFPTGPRPTAASPRPQHVGAGQGETGSGASGGQRLGLPGWGRQVAVRTCCPPRAPGWGSTRTAAGPNASGRHSRLRARAPGTPAGVGQGWSPAVPLQVSVGTSEPPKTRSWACPLRGHSVPGHSCMACWDPQALREGEAEGGGQASSCTCGRRGVRGEGPGGACGRGPSPGD